MFILQDGKVYVQEKNKLVGVEIYPDNVVKVKGTQTTLLDGKSYTPYEIMKKLNIRFDNPYIFPTDKPLDKGVDENGTDDVVKKPARKSRSK